MMPRALYVAHEAKLQSINLDDDSIDGPLWVFGMHMAFDPEASIKLQNLVESFGWAIVAREHPAEYELLGSQAETEQLLDNLVTMADNYKTQLMVHLTHHWLAKE